jgi:TusE/DsrC/DsvC family sulfur relay protein
VLTEGTVRIQERQVEVTDDDGFLRGMSTWTREIASELAERSYMGPLTDYHWGIIEYVRDFHLTNDEGLARPPR